MRQPFSHTWSSRFPLSAIALAASLATALAASTALANPAERDSAPADGWAGQQGGTRGGADAPAANIHTVANRAQLLAALARAGKAPSIIRVAGLIDMSEGRPFASSADQGVRGAVKLPSHTTLIGAGPQAGFVNASLTVSNATQVIIRNLHFQNPCDVGPVWDAGDGPKGEWNSEYDAITIAASTHVWVDHNSFTDAPVTDDLAPVENGRPKQCHDAALDITKGADLVTVSYNRFALHEKNMLIGSSDKTVSDDGFLSVTLNNNLFERVAARSPRVRFGRVHSFNNYHVGDRKDPIYPHVYSIGAGKQARIISTNNAFDIAGARGCASVIKNPGASPPGAFADSGSLLNGEPLGPCDLPGDPGWSVPYSFAPMASALVKPHVLANAGAGRLAPARAAIACPPAAEGVAVCQGVAAGKDYFIEARVRALPGGAASGQLYLLGRHVDAQHWLGAGVEISDGSAAVDAHIVSTQGGAIDKLKQVRRQMGPGFTSGEARLLTLRFEMIGQALSVYLNGERLSTAQLKGPVVAGQVGIYSKGKRFEVLDLRVGDPASKPMRLAPARGQLLYTAQAGDAVATIPISSLSSDGLTRERFSARSSNRAIVAVTASEGALHLTPLAEGAATITLSNIGDPSVQAIIDASIAPAFRMPAARLQLKQALARQGGTSSAVLPRPHSTQVQVDTPLVLKFDQAPLLGTAGSVRIYRALDDALVDVLRPGEEITTLGHAGQDQLRAVRHTPITVSGNSVTIKPHPKRLAYGAAYYVVVEEGLVSGATLAGQAFTGIGKDSGWRFRTRAAAPTGALLSVDDDGPADFRTVQGALNHAMQHIAKDVPATIAIRNGDYDELLYIRGKNRLTLRGQSRDGVLIHGRNNDGINPGTGLSQGPESPGASGGRALLLVEDADLLTLDTLTIKNTTLRSDKVSGQAEALYFGSDSGRLIARNASFFSEQDTIQVKGYAWFYRSLIAGNVDFIWGANRIALFEESEIRTVGDSANRDGGGYVVQARTLEAGDLGFVFLNSSLTHGPGPGPGARRVAPGSAYLARSPGTASTWDNVSYINCKMDEHIAAGGWAVQGVQRQPGPNPARANADSGWREYGSMDLRGKPLDLRQRKGGYLLSESEAAQRFGNRARIFAAFDGGRGWRPVP